MTAGMERQDLIDRYIGNAVPVGLAAEKSLIQRSSGA